VVVLEIKPNVSQQILDEDKSEDGNEPLWLLRFVGFLLWILVLFSIVVVITTFIIGVISYIVDPTFGQPII
jgi:amino acid permease